MLGLRSLILCIWFLTISSTPISKLFSQVELEYENLFAVIDKIHEPSVWKLPFGVIEVIDDEGVSEILNVGFLLEHSDSCISVISPDLSTKLLREKLAIVLAKGTTPTEPRIRRLKPRFSPITLHECFALAKSEKRFQELIGDLEAVGLARAARELGHKQLVVDFVSLTKQPVSLVVYQQHVASQGYRRLKMQLKDDRFTRARNRKLIHDFLVAFPTCKEANEAKSQLVKLTASIPQELVGSTVELIALLPKEQQVDELIYRVRSVADGSPVPIDGRKSLEPWPEEAEFGEGGNETQSPFQQLMDLGLTSFPKLLACLQDVSQAAVEQDMQDDVDQGNLPKDRSLAPVYQLLELIAAESFGSANGNFSVEKAGRWWQENQMLTEKQLLVRQINAQTALRFERVNRYLKLFPNEASQILIDTYRNWSGLTDKLQLIQMLSSQPRTTAIESFLNQLTAPTQPVLSIQLEAATALGTDSNRLRQLAVAKLDHMRNEKQFTTDFETAVDYLLQNEQTEQDLEAIADCFPLLSVDHFHYLLTQSDILCPNDHTDARAERMLIDLLSNETENEWSDFNEDKFFYRNPRVCDYALYCLKKRFPNRYQISRVATKVVRDIERLELINRYQIGSGQKLPESPNRLSSIKLNVIKPIELSETSALLGEISTATTQDEIKNAVFKYQQLGSGAVSALEKHIAAIDPDATEFWILHDLLIKLCGKVSNVISADASQDFSATLSGLETLEGDTLDIDHLKDLLITIMLDPKFEYDLVKVTFNRYRKDQGILIYATLTSAKPPKQGRIGNEWIVSSRSNGGSSVIKLDFEAILRETDFQLWPLRELEYAISDPKAECFDVEVVLQRR